MVLQECLGDIVPDGVVTHTPTVPYKYKHTCGVEIMNSQGTVGHLCHRLFIRELSDEVKVVASDLVGLNMAITHWVLAST